MDQQANRTAQSKNMLYLAIGLGLVSVVSCFSLAAAQMPAEEPNAGASSQNPDRFTATKRP